MSRKRCFSQSLRLLNLLTSTNSETTIYWLQCCEGICLKHLRVAGPRDTAVSALLFFDPSALWAGLKGENLQLSDLAYSEELREKLESKEAHHVSDEIREFKEQIGALLPWYKLWAGNFLTPKATSDLVAAIAETRQESTKATGDTYHERSDTSDEIAEIWFDILTSSGGIDEAALEEFKTWIGGLRHPTWTRLARLAAHTPNFEHQAMSLSSGRLNSRKMQRRVPNPKSIHM